MRFGLVIQDASNPQYCDECWGRQPEAVLATVCLHFGDGANGSDDAGTPVLLCEKHLEYLRNLLVEG